MGPWAARAEVVYAAEQDRVPTYDVPTTAYTIVNLAASYKLGFSGGEGLLFLRINNVTNELAYNATTIGTVRPLAPLPGRGVMAGLRISF
jgi:iron complex outermembrane receptor protein